MTYLVIATVALGVAGIITTVREELEWRRHVKACAGCPQCDEEAS